MLTDLGLKYVFSVSEGVARTPSVSRQRQEVQIQLTLLPNFEQTPNYVGTSCGFAARTQSGPRHSCDTGICVDNRR